MYAFMGTLLMHLCHKLQNVKFTYSVNPDEKPHNAAFHKGLLSTFLVTVENIIFYMKQDLF